MISLLHNATLFGTRVLLRADLNVPLEQGTIVDDFRLEALRPTLDLLVKKGARIIIATHLGRPKNHEPELSTEQLIPRFREKGYQVSWAPTLESAQQQCATLAPGTILLLENLRFFKEEKDPSLPSSTDYAQKLKNLAEYYVNDAWALVHEEQTSMSKVPRLFDEGTKTIGLLVERELAGLQPLIDPAHPFVIIMGGAKIAQKLPMIEQALEVADALIILPPLAFTFLKAQGKEVGNSLVEDALLGKAEDLLLKAERIGKPLILPVDFTYGAPDLRGPLSEGTDIPPEMIGIAVGPESLKQYGKLLKSARTVFLNGMMGFFEREDTLEPQKKLLQLIAQSNAYSAIGGGDSVAAAYLLGVGKDITFVSTGGGATLNYILYRTTPGLRYLDLE